MSLRNVIWERHQKVFCDHYEKYIFISYTIKSSKEGVLVGKQLKKDNFSVSNALIVILHHICIYSQ